MKDQLTFDLLGEQLEASWHKENSLCKAQWKEWEYENFILGHPAASNEMYLL